jgi:ribosomal protein S3AE
LIRIITDKKLLKTQKNKIRKIVNHLIQESVSRLKIKKGAERILDEEDNDEGIQEGKLI